MLVNNARNVLFKRLKPLQRLFILGFSLKVLPLFIQFIAGGGQLRRSREFTRSPLADAPLLESELDFQQVNHLNRNTANISHLAARWSLNPAALKPDVFAKSAGITGELFPAASETETE